MRDRLQALGLLMLIGCLLYAGTAWAKWIAVVETDELKAHTSPDTVNFRAADNSGPTFQTHTFATTNHHCFYTHRAAAGTAASPAIIQDNGLLYYLSIYGYDGANSLEMAAIQCEVDGTPGVTDLPSAWVFYVSVDGTASAVEAFRISNDKSATLQDNVYLVTGKSIGILAGPYLQFETGPALMSMEDGSFIFNGDQSDFDCDIQGVGGTGLFMQGSDRFVGILTNAPVYALDVRGEIGFGDGGADDSIYANGDTDTRLRRLTDRWITYAGGIPFWDAREATQDWALVNPDGNDIDFTVLTDNDANTLFIEGSSDRLAMGTDDTTTYVTKLVVDADAGASPGYAAAFINGDNEADAYGIIVESGRYTIQANDQFIHCASRSDGLLGGVEWDGGDIAVFTSSDKKWKENIRDTLRNSLGVVKQVRFRDYERNGQTVQNDMIAQEIEALMPDAVTTRTFNKVIWVPVQLPDGSTTKTTETVQQTSMFISMGVVDRYYRQAVTQLAKRDQEKTVQLTLQGKQIEWFRAEAEKRGWDMSTFPSQ